MDFFIKKKFTLHKNFKFAQEFLKDICLQISSTFTSSKAVGVTM